jgi:hypothetical protein
LWLLVVTAIGCGAAGPHAADGAGDVQSPEAAAIERRLTGRFDASATEIHSLAARLRRGEREVPLRRLIEIAEGLLSDVEVLKGCEALVAAREVAHSVFEEQVACEAQLNKLRHSQQMDVLRLMAEAPSAETLAFARKIALDPRNSPVTRTHAIAVLEATPLKDPALLQQAREVRAQLDGAKRFFAANPGVMHKIARELQSCRARYSRSAIVVVTLHPSGELKSVVASELPEALVFCVRSVFARQAFNAATPQQEVVFSFRLRLCAMADP